MLRSFCSFTSLSIGLPPSKWTRSRQVGSHRRTSPQISAPLPAPLAYALMRLAVDIFFRRYLLMNINKILTQRHL